MSEITVKNLLVTECLLGVVVGEAEALEETAPWDNREFILSTEGSRAPGSLSSASEEPGGKVECLGLSEMLTYDTCFTSLTLVFLF